MEKVTAVLPAYNEGKTVAHIVSVLRHVPEIGEIIVVSDGSSDNTADQARLAGASVLELTENKGKGGAVAAGMRDAQNPVILLLDADLIGLTTQHVQDLIRPVLSHEVDMAVGIFIDGNLITDLAQRVAPYLSGQRALRASVFAGLDLDDVGFGLEVNLTYWASKANLKVKHIDLLNMSHTLKEQKVGIVGGAKARIKMYQDIITTYVQCRSQDKSNVVPLDYEKSIHGKP